MTLSYSFETDTDHLQRMAEAIDLFVAQQEQVGDLVGTLARLSDYLYTVPPNWRRMFLNLWRSIELITAEAQRNKRELSEMELRFVLSLCLDLKDMIASVREPVMEIVAEPAT